MYRKLLIILFALLMIQPSYAQQTFAEARREFKREYKEAHRYDPVSHSFSLQWSQWPFFARTNFNGYTLKQMSDFFETRKSTLSYVYSDYTGETHCTGSFIAEYNMLFTSGRALSIDLAASFFWKERFNGISGDKEEARHGTVLYLLPKYRFGYLTRKTVRLYGDFGIGAGLYFGFGSKLRPAFQINPIGLEVGNKIYGMMQIGFGSLYTGGSIGIGYKL